MLENIHLAPCQMLTLSTLEVLHMWVRTLLGRAKLQENYLNKAASLHFRWLRDEPVTLPNNFVLLLTVLVIYLYS